MEQLDLGRNGLQEPVSPAAAQVIASRVMER